MLDKIIINGGRPLKGEVFISGAKNAAVAILPAVLLCNEPCRIENIPEISDVATLIRIIYELGGKVKVINSNTVEIDPKNINSFVVSADMSRRMRASSYFIGAMLGRFNKARIA
ncbi:MAG: UDP-N-acetylglucosamine 1-carboxyvinyltransferase, partial [Clostridia bacterium]|nr:UDP-N-acetylglucosamine 1-carboxyvinyltransferase [Clostridia bacterium]